jgi:hypothetical protein
MLLSLVPAVLVGNCYPAGPSGRYASEACLPGIWVRWLALAPQCPMSSSAASTTQNQSQPVSPRPGVYNSTYIRAETFLRERPDRAHCTDERERATLRPTTLEAATRADLEAFMAEVLLLRAPHGGNG